MKQIITIETEYISSIYNLSELKIYIGCRNIFDNMKIASLNACGAYCDDCPSYVGKKEPVCMGC